MTSNTSYPVSIITCPWYFQSVAFNRHTLHFGSRSICKNPTEAVYAVIACIFFMVLAFYVGDVLAQVASMSQERRIFYKQNIISFDNFMQLKEVSTAIRDNYNFFELDLVSVAKDGVKAVGVNIKVAKVPKGIAVAIDRICQIQLFSELSFCSFAEVIAVMYLMGPILAKILQGILCHALKDLIGLILLPEGEEARSIVAVDKTHWKSAWNDPPCMPSRKYQQYVLPFEVVEEVVMRFLLSEVHRVAYNSYTYISQQMYIFQSSESYKGGLNGRG